MITIVSGLPRSGTSLMMQMLAKGGMPVLTDDIRQADDNNLRGYFEYDKVKNLRNDNKWLAEADGKAVKIITQLLPFVAKDHDYTVLYMVRPIEEVIRSQRKMLESLGQQGAKIASEDLIKAYSAQTSRVQSWLAAARIKVLFMFYPDIMSNPVERAKEIQSFLDVGLDIEGMASAVDVNMWHQKNI